MAWKKLNESEIIIKQHCLKSEVCKNVIFEENCPREIKIKT